MIQDADQIDLASTLHADVCVVGGGPAGIVSALALASSGSQVLLLESGGNRPSHNSQALCVGELANPLLHAPLDTYRRRGIGGSSTVWGGRCVPLDPIDFSERDWLDLPPGWPVSYDDLLPYWRRAHAIAELGNFDYQASTAVPGGMKPMFPSFTDNTVSTNSIERFSRPTDFGIAYMRQLKTNSRIRLVTHATVTEIRLDVACAGVDHLLFCSSGGTIRRAVARTFILAAGGLEVPRLLLASHRQMASGIGNGHDQVGRYYMCHLAGVLGRFIPSLGQTPFNGYERADGGIYVRRRLSISPAEQRARRMGNMIARLHHPRLANPRHQSAVLSSLFLLSGALPYEYRVRLQDPCPAADYGRHIANLMADPLGTSKFLWSLTHRRVLARRKLPSVVLQPPGRFFTLDVHAEQLPHPDSRISLAQARDRNGMPLLHVDWRYSRADLHTVQSGLAVFASAFSRAGCGELSVEADNIDAEILRDGAYGGHHLGTARMSSSPLTGVVDANCRVHGIRNLYIASSAVFPTSGQANPTLTILALALRVADFVRDVDAPAQRTGYCDCVRADSLIL